jgi:hypothetical protein
MELDVERRGYPAIFEVNVDTGCRRLHSHPYYPVRNFTTDRGRTAERVRAL